MNSSVAEEYIASLYATVLKRDPLPDEFAFWVTTAAAWPPEKVYFAFVNSKEYKLQEGKSVPTVPTAEAAVKPIDISTYLFPDELCVTDVPLKKVLMVGACLTHGYTKWFRDIDPGLEIDLVPFNYLRQLPPVSTTQLDSYQLQYVQIPLRHVLTDRVMRIFDIDRAQAFNEILKDARALLAVMLDAAMAYNVQHGLLTLVANFFVPQGSAAPSLADFGGDADLTALIAGLNNALADLVRNYQNAYVADVDGLANSYGKRYFRDDVFLFYTHGHILDRGWTRQVEEDDSWPVWSAPNPARIEPVPDITALYQLQAEPFARLVLDQIRYLHRVVLQTDQVKIVIFDLDNTLWRGQIAEHYESGREWPAYESWPLGIWEAVHYLRRRGIVVSVCSKNDENVVRERWSRAVRLPWISLDDFIAPKINWKPKSENVRAILSELSLSAKSAVFVDDNPAERSEVLNRVPGIRVIGGNPYVTRRILLWAAETQRSLMTAESTKRETSYRAIVDRNAESAVMDRDTFLQNLRTVVELHQIINVDSSLLPRVLELANKTTQFNTTGLKWTVPELTSFIENQGSLFAFSVRDKFVDYGLVGAVFVSAGAVRQYVMSCRVLGLDIEVDALKQVLQIVRERDEGPLIIGTVIPTEVNTPCRDIFLRSGFQATGESGTFAIAKDVL
jgi:FkbH-like protein